jgi:hypothetical protein
MAKAHIECSILNETMEVVENSGPPLHRRETSRLTNYNPKESSIFIVESRDFEEMAPRKIQEIFRHRHILVRNSPGARLDFDHDGLSTLGPLDKEFYFQGEPNWCFLFFF